MLNEALAHFGRRRWPWIPVRIRRVAQSKRLKGLSRGRARLLRLQARGRLIDCDYRVARGLNRGFMGKSADGDILNIEEKRGGAEKGLTPAVFLAVLLFFVSIAYGRNMVWMNQLMLWTDAADSTLLIRRGRMAPLEIIMSGPVYLTRRKGFSLSVCGFILMWRHGITMSGLPITCRGGMKTQ